MKRFAGLALLTALAAGPVAAQDPGSRQTRDFVAAAGESDSFEIMEATTALAESHDKQVLAFAQQMIRDHERTRRTLEAATREAGLAPPPSIVGASQAPMLAALQSQRAPAFDTVYWTQQALAHRSALTVAQAYAASGDVPAVRKAAAATVPTIQAHLAMAERMRAQAARGD